LYMGFEDYLAKDGIIIIEWPEIIESLLPKNTISIEFTYGDSENERLLQIHSPRELIL
ncbi:MAG: tRNA (adenosine(37)-N6)-threonylcarbamoyltransferase complex ATPase subunit type 1 TsaE, partial [Candidatus Marinimicrobia bacterium]|nr:tRNA (adenosine(37)-N6)-threonylcarbamoyltransferase complex ATPase subunit type 1 TsaE [Candidatus Neomarinimicrobiota bacterium]